MHLTNNHIQVCAVSHNDRPLNQLVEIFHDAKGAEGYAARFTFRKAKEGINIAIHWQDADSSSSNAMTEHFPDAEIMICGGHAGKAHKKQLEKLAKKKSFTDQFKKMFPGRVPAFLAEMLSIKKSSSVVVANTKCKVLAVMATCDPYTISRCDSMIP